MGQVGLVNLISPLIRATPVTSVVTDDLGYLTPGDACGCGLTSPYLTLLGRVGLGTSRPAPPARRTCWERGGVLIFANGRLLPGQPAVPGAGGAGGGGQ